MKKILIFSIYIIGYTLKSFAGDTLSFSCKYRYTKQKDSLILNSKFEDIMVLTVNKNASTYYSYLKHFGYRKMESDERKANQNITNKVVEVNEKSANNYFIANESEIIKINYKKKVVHFSDKLITYSYSYSDSINTPKWQIENETKVIIKQNYQKATTTFKGRHYVAWFASSLPFSMGPWLFNGLPGLIMGVSDDKGQFVFECIEINSPSNTTKVFKSYTEIKNVSRKVLIAKKNC